MEKKYLNAKDSCYLNASIRTCNIRNALPAKAAFLDTTPIAKSISKSNPIQRIEAFNKAADI